MAHERAAMERQMAKLRQSSAAPARHARFGGLFVKRYNSESRGSVMRSNPLVPDLPAIPELKKTSKTQVIYICLPCICDLPRNCLASVPAGVD